MKSLYGREINTVSQPYRFMADCLTWPILSPNTFFPDDLYQLILYAFYKIKKKNKLDRINAKLRNEMSTEEILEKENINFTKTRNEEEEDTKPPRMVWV